LKIHPPQRLKKTAGPSKTYQVKTRENTHTLRRTALGETKPSVIARYSSSKVVKEFFLENCCYFIRFCLAPQSVAKT
jgi:hypothetical protein